MTPRTPSAPPPDVLDGNDDYIVVPRDYVRRNGWPDRWLDLDALVGAQTEGFTKVRMRKGDVCQQAYQGALNIAYMRQGDGGEAFLYAQCWRGPA